MISDIPESLKTNKSIVPYILRSNELEEINPIVSYYCKIYVLEHILNQKLHKNDKEVESFTIQLLDETEQIKTSDDESLTKVLADKNLSISVVYAFILKVFNGCINDLNNYNGSNKPQLVSKIKACLNFMGLLEVFKNDEINVTALTNGKYETFEAFAQFNKDRIKLLKYNLSKLIKDELEIKGEEDELDRELKQLEIKKDESAEGVVPEHSNETESLGDPDPIQNTDEAPDQKDTQEPSLDLPSTPQFIDEPEESDSPNLPGVPHFSPEDDSDIKLPGAPSFLPDDDLSHINKNSSIHVIRPDAEQPKSSQSKATPPKATQPKHKAKTEHPQHITPENIDSILDVQSLISSIQKHCKFAISALNYEDISTAEKELLEGLDLIRRIKANQPST